MKRVVSFSGGKDSTAMLFKLLENGVKIDYVLYVDLGAEYPEMYEHMKKVDEKLEKFNLHITTLKPKYTLIEYMTIYQRKRGKSKGLPYSFPTLRNRWCTALKRQLTNKFKNQLNDVVIDYVGFAVSEKKRAEKFKKRENETLKYHFPLIEWNMTEQDALEYCYSLGFDWNGLYEHMKRVSCFVCPLQSNKDLRYLINERKELWAQIKQIENVLQEKGIAYWKFQQNRSCEELEAKFGGEKNV